MTNALCKAESLTAHFPDAYESSTFENQEEDMNTQLMYLYRDAGNYKQLNQHIISGTLAEKEIIEIISCTENGNFIPSQVGLPEERFETWGEDDHVWFELDSFGFTETQEDADTELPTAHELLDAFRKAKGRWDEEAALEHIFSFDVQNENEEELFTEHRAWPTDNLLDDAANEYANILYPNWDFTKFGIRNLWSFRLACKDSLYVTDDGEVFIEPDRLVCNLNYYMRDEIRKKEGCINEDRPYPDDARDTMLIREGVENMIISALNKSELTEREIDEMIGERKRMENLISTYTEKIRNMMLQDFNTIHKSGNGK